MSVIINFAGASIRKPGSYSRTRVAQGGASEPQLGVMAIVGEAAQGSAYAAETGGLDAVTYGPDQFGDILEKFGSGALVDAARLAFAPSVDPQIPGGAQQLIVLKTNQSVKAQLAVLTGYGTVYAKKAGVAGNNLSLTIANSSGQRVITIADAVTGDSEVSSAIGGVTALTIQIAGGASAATLTINATQIITTVTGGTAPSLTLSKSQFATLGQLQSYLSGQVGYTVTLGTNQQSQPLDVLDRVTAADVFTAPYNVLRDAYDIRAFFAESGLLDFTPTLYVGLPAVMAKTFLAGGALGATTNANIQACVDELSKRRINFVVPLFSRDATSDITDSLTDASSSYTIDSIHAMIRTHNAQNSTVKGKKERQGWVAFDGTYANAKAKAAALGGARVGLVIQRVDIVNAAGDLVTAKPHMAAVIAAGMKCSAPVGLPNTFKLANISGFSMASSDFDPETQADDAIDAGIAFFEKAPGGGFRWVLDNSTYSQAKDAWIYARPSVLYAADTAAYSIRLNTEAFIGQRNSDVTEETVKNLLISVMDSLKSAGIIVPDAASGGKGFKDLSVRIEGSVIRISVTLVLVEGVEFVLSDILVQRAQF